MQTQLIQKKVQIGSQVEFTLTTGNQVSGLLKEISLEHVTLNAAKGEMTILVESIIAVQSLDNVNDLKPASTSPDMDNQVNTSDSLSSKPNTIEGSDSANLSTSEVDASNPSDVNAELTDSVSEQAVGSDTVDANTESTNPVPEPITTSEPVNANTEPTDSVSEQAVGSDTVDANTESTNPVPEPITTSEPVNANTEPTDSVSEQAVGSDTVDANTESTDSVNFEEQASEQLDEIDNRFKNEIEGTKIELKPPDLTFPATELTGWQNTGIVGKWGQIKNKYEYAKKINELSSKFGRIKPLLTELKSLVKRFPNSQSLKRAFAYFYALSDDWQEATQIYKEVAITSENANDWFNVAVSALNLNTAELACYSLEKFFNGVSVINESNAWYIYVNLVEKFNNLFAFRELCKKDENNVVENEIEVLLDAAIYLLKKKVATELAIEVVKKRIKGERAKPLLMEVSQKLGGQSAGSYRQFLTEFMNERIALEKKGNSIHPAYSESVGNTKPSTGDITLQKPHSRPKVELTGEELYKEAERADKIEKNLEKAEHLYRECIRLNIRPDSAIMDLAMVYIQLDLPDEAVKLLEDNRYKVKHKQRLNNLLTTTVYPKAGQYEKVITLLNSNLKQEQKKEKRWQIFWQIANAYIRLRNYTSAESQFLQALELRPDNIAMQRSLAFCFSQQKRYDKAEEILNRIQNTSPDTKTAELLEAIKRAKVTGEFILDDDSIIEIETALSYFSGELSEFAQFFLERCTFEGIPTGRVNDGKYTGSEKDVQYDIGRLEDIAKQLGTKSPRDRSNYYLSASRIYVDVGDDRNFFYRYLCRSFASRGDDAVSENRNLDTIQEWYCAALTVYDGDRSRHKDEQDAVNSLVRYLYSTLGHAHIQLTPNTSTIDKAVRDVVSNHPDREKVFDAIVYLVLHSRYAADKILNRLYSNETLRTMALDYLENMKIAIPDAIERFNDFVRPWNELQNEKFNTARTISNKLRLLDNFELTTAWLEDNIRLAENIRSNLFFKLDQQRVGELQRLLETALELCKQGTFEERERLCIQLRSYCQALLGEIEESPTRLSVEDVYPIIEVIQEKVTARLNALYKDSKPQLTLRLPVESYVPNTDRKIEVQIVLENERGRSPAESLELVIQEDKAFFAVTEPHIKQNESLRGGEQSILTVPLRVTPDALQFQTFSLPVGAQYRTRTEEQAQTPVQNLSIRLYSEDEFEKIENPYATYAEGGVVGDANMFFGREELIQNIAQAIRESRTQSKCVLVFGQKRSGKSSVLYHLKKLLEESKDLLILNVENIGSIQDPDSEVPLLYQILKDILTTMEYAVEDRIDKGFTPLHLSIPDDIAFYQHPAPLQCFQNTFRSFIRHVSNQEDWRSVRVVLLIDEFQYIYDRIVAGEIPESFMQNWKALLQANYFNAVLVGQDVMPKFKARFPNEFGTTQDERVTYLKPDDARRLIDEPICIDGRQDNSRYREHAIERILDLTAGSPFYIQIICNRLVEYMNVKHAGLVTEADVEQVKNELIRDVNALGSDKFDNLINSGDTSADAISDEDALKVLKAIADNSSKTDPCHRDRIDCETSSQVDTILDDLEKRDVVKRREQSYQIQVGLFKEWLIVNR